MVEKLGVCEIYSVDNQFLGSFEIWSHDPLTADYWNYIEGVGDINIVDYTKAHAYINGIDGESTAVNFKIVK